MLPEVFDFFREISLHSRPPFATKPVPFSPTQKRFFAILSAALLPLTIAGMGLGYFIGGHGTRLFALAEAAVIAVTMLVGFTIIRTLRRPIDLEAQVEKLDWLERMDALDEPGVLRRIAVRWLREAALLTLLGLIPVMSTVTCSMAVIHATRVLEIAKSLSLPPAYRRAAHVVRISAVVILVSFGTIAAFLLLFSLRPAYPPPTLLQP